MCIYFRTEWVLNTLSAAHRGVFFFFTTTQRRLVLVFVLVSDWMEIISL